METPSTSSNVKKLIAGQSSEHLNKLAGLIGPTAGFGKPAIRPTNRGSAIATNDAADSSSSSSATPMPVMMGFKLPTSSAMGKRVSVVLNSQADASSSSSSSTTTVTTSTPAKSSTIQHNKRAKVAAGKRKLPTKKGFAGSSSTSTTSLASTTEKKDNNNTSAIASSAAPKPPTTAPPVKKVTVAVAPKVTITASPSVTSIATAATSVADDSAGADNDIEAELQAQLSYNEPITPANIIEVIQKLQSCVNDLLRHESELTKENRALLMQLNQLRHYAVERSQGKKHNPSSNNTTLTVHSTLSEPVPVKAMDSIAVMTPKSSANAAIATTAAVASAVGAGAASVAALMSAPMIHTAHGSLLATHQQRSGQLDAERKNAPPKVFKAGWIEIDNGQGKNWKRRFFILYDNTIEFYDNPRVEKPKGTFSLEICSITPAQLHQKIQKTCMELTVGDKKFHFFASSSQDNQSWFSAITNRILTLSYIRKCQATHVPLHHGLLRYLNQYQAESDIDSSSSANTVATNKLVLTPSTAHVAITNDVIQVLQKMMDPHTPVCTTIEVLDLTMCRLTDNEMKLLAPIIEKSSNLIELNMTANPITVASAQLLAQALQSNSCGVSTLRLQQCDIGDEGVKYLAQALPFTRVKHLDLSFCHLSHVAAQHLATVISLQDQPPAHLIHLTLNGNPLGDEGAKALLPIMDKALVLQRLDLINTQLTDVAAELIAKTMKSKTSHILHLYLHGEDNHFSHQAASRLAHMTQVNKTLEQLTMQDWSISSIHSHPLSLINAHGLNAKVA